MQFLLQAASLEIYGYTLVECVPMAFRNTLLSICESQFCIQAEKDAPSA
jgi:hypothetical protein